MATRFELILFGARAAGEEALAEIARLDARLSRAWLPSLRSTFPGYDGAVC